MCLNQFPKKLEVSFKLTDKRNLGSSTRKNDFFKEWNKKSGIIDMTEVDLSA